MLFTSPPAASAKPCGDTSGPGGSDVPCSCGDTVTTSTRLDETDPVLLTLCLEHGLRIGDGTRPELLVDIGGALRGGGDGRGYGLIVEASSSSQTITVRGGQISGFNTGVQVTAGRPRFSGLQVFGNSWFGVNLENAQGAIIEESTIRDNGGPGIGLGSGAIATGNLVEANGGPGILANSNPGGIGGLVDR